MRNVLLVIVTISLVGCTYRLDNEHIVLAQKFCEPHGGLKNLWVYDNSDSNAFPSVRARCNDISEVYLKDVKLSK